MEYVANIPTHHKIAIVLTEVANGNVQCTGRIEPFARRRDARGELGIDSLRGLVRWHEREFSAK